MDGRPRSLMEMLADIPDPRSAHGQRHPLTAILALTVLAMLAGMKSLEAIAQFGRDHGKPLAEALGFRRHRTPCKATFSNIFRALDVQQFEQILSEWIQARPQVGGDHIAIDGKVLRGSKEGELPGLYLLSAFEPETSAVLAQIEVKSSTNEHKAALELLGVLPLSGKVVTGDGIFTQHEICRQIGDRGGDYLLFAKENQPSLKRAIELAFGPDEAFSPLHSTGTSESASRGSGI